MSVGVALVLGIAIGCASTFLGLAVGMHLNRPPASPPPPRHPHTTVDLTRLWTTTTRGDES